MCPPGLSSSIPGCSPRFENLDYPSGTSVASLSTMKFRVPAAKLVQRISDRDLPGPADEMPDPWCFPVQVAVEPTDN